MELLVMEFMDLNTFNQLINKYEDLTNSNNQLNSQFNEIHSAILSIASNLEAKRNRNGKFIQRIRYLFFTSLYYKKKKNLYLIKINTLTEIYIIIIKLIKY